MVLREDGIRTEAYDYYAFGLTLPGRTYGSGTKEKFTGKERDTETGWDYFGARYYNPTIARWMNVDPLSDKYPSWSPYNYVMNSPMMAVDPDGKAPNPPGDYYNEQGEKIATDGKRDGKVYLIKTTKTTSDLYGDVSPNAAGTSLPISSESAQDTEAKLKSGDFTGGHMSNVVYVGTERTLNALSRIASQDNGEGGRRAANNREYAATISPRGQVTEEPPGPVMSPRGGQAANVEVTVRPGAAMHTHPSGTENFTSRGNSYTAQWGGNSQAPSKGDFPVVNRGSLNMVFAMRSQSIYLYNRQGVVATAPLNFWKK